MFWTGGTAKDWQYVFTRFRQKYPFLTTDYWRATDADLYQKITMEARAGHAQCRRFWGRCRIPATLKKIWTDEEIRLAEYCGWSPQYKDREGYWIAHHVLCLVIAYNTDLVSAS